MYTGVSNEFKQAVKSDSITPSAKVVFKDPKITLIGKAVEPYKSSLQTIDLVDKCYDSSKGILIGNTPSKKLEINIINKDNLDLADKEFEFYAGIKLSNGTFEYVPYGTFIVTEYKDMKHNNIYKIIAFDYMTKLNPKFNENKIFNPTYPITLKQYKIQFLASYGLNCEEQTLPNDNFIINSAIEFEGMTARAILGRIAELQGSFAKINRNDKVQFYLKTNTTEKIDAMSMNSKLEIDKQYGGVNVVSIGMSNIEGENVTLKDDVSIQKLGREVTIRIDDNPFVYTQELREQAIQELYNYLKGFTYRPTKFQYKPRFYLDCGDEIQVENVEDKQFVNSIVLNQHIKIPYSRQSTLENLALTETQVKHKYISKTEQANSHTEILVDKQNQKITSVVSQVDGQNKKISKVEQTVSELNSKISDIADITKMQESNNGILVFDNINQSEPINIKIHPIVENISYLYPRENLYPSESLFLTDRILRFTNTQDNTVINYLIPDDLLYYDSNNYDEFILDYDLQVCKVIKRVEYNADGTTYILPTEKEINYTYPKIPLTDGDYKIELLGYNTAYMQIRLMSQNIYTTQFATKVEMNSKINQKADEITLEVSKSYATKGELNTAKTEIKQTTDSITSTVSKKVGKNEVVSTINQSAEGLEIDANKLNINRCNFC